MWRDTSGGRVFLPTLYNSSDRKERDKDAKKVEKEGSDRSGSSGRSCGYRNRFFYLSQTRNI